MILRSEFSFFLDCPEKIGLYIELIRRNKVSATIRSNHSDWIYEALKMISQHVVNETLFALVGTSKVKGNEYFALYLSYDEDELKCLPGELFILTKRQLISLGAGEDYNGILSIQCTQDVEAMITVTSKVLKLPFETVKTIIKSIFNKEYLDIPDFFNVLERKVLPNILPSEQIMSFIDLLCNVTTLGKTKLHAYNQTGCYVKEKEEYLNQIMAI